MEVIQAIIFVLGLIFTIIYSYQLIFTIIGLFSKKHKYKEASENHTFAVVICGRNEEKVIGNLIESIKNNDYPQDKIKIFVCADNCTDKTAEICRAFDNCTVYERFNQEKIGKGYALNFLFKNIAKDFPDYVPDATLVFDADNILTKNYIKEMNKALDSGVQICTSYRNSKNYGSSWISKCSSLIFMRECSFCHKPKMALKLGTVVSGTGFYFSKEVLTFKEGWEHFTISEDLEFSAFNTLKGVKIGYCEDAEFFDEQPTTFKQSWKQRLRWSRGGVIGFSLFHGAYFSQFLKTHNFNFYDYYFSRFFPRGAYCGLSFIAAQIVGLISNILNVVNNHVIASVFYFLTPLIVALLTTYLGLLVDGLLATIVNWKKIKATKWQKISTIFVYPLFSMFLAVPAGIVALFKKVKWDPIEHDHSVSQKELEMGE